MAHELSEKDVIRAHARDELGIDVDDLANPLQASAASAVAFSLGAAVPLLTGARPAPRPGRGERGRLWRPSRVQSQHPKQCACLPPAQLLARPTCLIHETTDPAAAPAPGAFIAHAFTRLLAVAAAATVGLALFGGSGAWLGGASVAKGSARVLVGGWLAMGVTYGIGKLFGGMPL